MCPQNSILHQCVRILQIAGSLLWFSMWRYNSAVHRARWVVSSLVHTHSCTSQCMSTTSHTAGLHIAENMVHFRIGRLQDVSTSSLLLFRGWTVCMQLFCHFLHLSTVSVTHAECSDALLVSVVWHCYKLWQHSRHCTIITWKMKLYTTRHKWSWDCDQQTPELYLCIILVGFLKSFFLQLPFVCIIHSLLIKVLHLREYTQVGLDQSYVHACIQMNTDQLHCATHCTCCTHTDCPHNV